VVQDQHFAGRGLPLAKPAEQSPRAQCCRRYPAADVTHHDGLAKFEAQHVTRVHPGIDTAHDRSVWLVGNGRPANAPAADLEFRWTSSSAERLMITKAYRAATRAAGPPGVHRLTRGPEPGCDRSDRLALLRLSRLTAKVSIESEAFPVTTTCLSPGLIATDSG
jgi:hypothetical protein